MAARQLYVIIDGGGNKSFRTYSSNHKDQSAIQRLRSCGYKVYPVAGRHSGQKKLFTKGGKR